jgi:hypothetical protein
MNQSTLDKLIGMSSQEDLISIFMEIVNAMTDESILSAVLELDEERIDLLSDALISGMSRVRRPRKMEYESSLCPFCEIPMCDTESVSTGICASCRDVIHSEQYVAWESPGERLCQGLNCSALLQIGDGNYCVECRRKVDRLEI